ncbi:hypothetical protein AZSI13_32510 [Azospira sp. I13]|nr:hypothetical protein AZSI13_32510 [Azospira sp. I13]
MPRRNWKCVLPLSLPHAMELCLDYAREKQNRSVDRVADLMGLANKWRLYKWIAEGNLPSNLIRPFEHACGTHFVTRYLAYSAHQLLIDIPTGKTASSGDIQVLQEATNAAVGALINFAAGKSDAPDVLATVSTAMEAFAWHRINVEKHSQPELDLDQ